MNSYHVTRPAKVKRCSKTYVDSTGTAGFVYFNSG
jgi:hypothetical protein